MCSLIQENLDIKILVPSPHLDSEVFQGEGMDCGNVRMFRNSEADLFREQTTKPFF